jgi:hypothetical protein
MSTFVELLKESVIMRGILAIVVIGVASYLVIAQLPVPEWFVGLAGAITGYFFGSRPLAAVERAKEVADLKATIAAGFGGG